MYVCMYVYIYLYIYISFLITTERDFPPSTFLGPTRYHFSQEDVTKGKGVRNVEARERWFTYCRRSLGEVDLSLRLKEKLVNKHFSTGEAWKSLLYQQKPKLNTIFKLCASGGRGFQSACGDPWVVRLNILLELEPQATFLTQNLPRAIAPISSMPQTGPVGQVKPFHGAKNLTQCFSKRELRITKYSLGLGQHF